MDNLKSFVYVLTISEARSISEAAESLGIAQSALSRYLLKLEKDLGMELFDRSTLPIILTEAGRYYVEASRKILDINRCLEKQLEEVRLKGNLEVRVGIGPSRAPVLMPLILSLFSKSYPEVRVHTAEHRTAELAEKLETGKLDLIITFLDHDTDRYSMEDLFEERVELVTPAKYLKDVECAVENGVVDIEKVDAPFISLHKGQRLRYALDILTHNQVKPLYDSDYLESAMALVNHGFGVTLVPSYWKLMDDRHENQYFPISIPVDLPADDKNRLTAIINRRIGIFYRKEQFLSDAEKGFIRAAKEVCRAIR